MTIDSHAFREALAHWASGVAILACRHDGRVVATTISAFMALSADAALVLLALGPNATIRPFLAPHARFGLSVLAIEQKRAAMIYADPYPVGPDPFTHTDAPLIPDALVTLTCTVVEANAGADHVIITASVDTAQVRHGSDPLIRFHRRYHALSA